MNASAITRGTSRAANRRRLRASISAGWSARSPRRHSATRWAPCRSASRVAPDCSTTRLRCDGTPNRRRTPRTAAAYPAACKPRHERSHSLQPVHAAPLAHRRGRHAQGACGSTAWAAQRRATTAQAYAEPPATSERDCEDAQSRSGYAQPARRIGPWATHRRLWAKRPPARSYWIRRSFPRLSPKLAPVRQAAYRDPATGRFSGALRR